MPFGSLVEGVKAAKKAAKVVSKNAKHATTFVRDRYATSRRDGSDQSNEPVGAKEKYATLVQEEESTSTTEKEDEPCLMGPEDTTASATEEPNKVEDEEDGFNTGMLEQGNSTTPHTSSRSQRIREVRRWPGRLRLVKARLCISHLQEGDAPLSGVVSCSVNAASGMLKATQGVMKSVSQLGQRAQINGAEAAVVLGTFVAAGAAISLPGMIEKDNPGLISAGGGALSHFLVVLEFEDEADHTMVRHCTIERTANHGVVLMEGKPDRVPLIVGRVIKTWKTNVTLEAVLAFRDEEDKKAYCLRTNNCKHTVYSFVREVLRDTEYMSCRTFRLEMHRKFLAGLRQHEIETHEVVDYIEE